jgi:hypothetical protein
MDFYMTCIDHEPFKIRLVHELFPMTFVAPAAETPVGVFPIPIVFRQVSPWCTCSQNPHDGIDEKSVVSSKPTPTSCSSGKKGFKDTPNSITDIVPPMTCFHGAKL